MPHSNRPEDAKTTSFFADANVFAAPQRDRGTLRIGPREDHSACQTGRQGRSANRVCAVCFPLRLSRHDASALRRVFRLVSFIFFRSRAARSQHGGRTCARRRRDVPSTPHSLVRPTGPQRPFCLLSSCGLRRSASPPRFLFGVPTRGFCRASSP